MWTRDIQVAVSRSVTKNVTDMAEHGRLRRLFSVAGLVDLQIVKTQGRRESFLLSRMSAGSCRVSCLPVSTALELNQGPVPVNLKDHDAFHLTIEEYLHALISLIEELVRPELHVVTFRC